MQLCKDGPKFPADSLAVRSCKNGDLSFSVRSWKIKVTEQNTLDKLEYIDYNACVYYTVFVFLPILIIALSYYKLELQANSSLIKVVED